MPPTLTAACVPRFFPGWGAIGACRGIGHLRQMSFARYPTVKRLARTHRNFGPVSLSLCCNAALSSFALLSSWAGVELHCRILSRIFMRNRKELSGQVGPSRPNLAAAARSEHSERLCECNSLGRKVQQVCDRPGCGCLVGEAKDGDGGRPRCTNVGRAVLKPDP